MFRLVEWVMNKIVESENEPSEHEYSGYVQARLSDDGEDGWVTMGDVSHVDAAHELAEMYDYDGIVLTKTRDSKVIFKHRVSKKTVFHVTPMRAGS